MSCSVHPCASRPIMSSTVMRVPRITGFPTITLGSSAMRGCSAIMRLRVSLTIAQVVMERDAWRFCPRGPAMRDPCGQTRRNVRVQIDTGAGAFAHPTTTHFRGPNHIAGSINLVLRGARTRRQVYAVCASLTACARLEGRPQARPSQHLILIQVPSAAADGATDCGGQCIDDVAEADEIIRLHIS